MARGRIVIRYWSESYERGRRHETVSEWELFVEEADGQLRRVRFDRIYDDPDGLLATSAAKSEAAVNGISAPEIDGPARIAEPSQTRRRR
jgi:hypothetical protein